MGKEGKKSEAPPRFELGISCLLDRRFNQLSHGAKPCDPDSTCQPDSTVNKRKSGERVKHKKLIAQRGARTHDPEIKSLMLYRLS